MRTTSQPHISTVGQVVKTLPFHGSIMGSIPIRCIQVNLVTLDALISLSVLRPNLIQLLLSTCSAMSDFHKLVN